MEVAAATKQAQHSEFDPSGSECSAKPAAEYYSRCPESAALQLREPPASLEKQASTIRYQSAVRWHAFFDAHFCYGCAAAADAFRRADWLCCLLYRICDLCGMCREQPGALRSPQ